MTTTVLTGPLSAEGRLKSQQALEEVRRRLEAGGERFFEEPKLLGRLLRRYYMLLGHIPRVGTDTAHTFLFSHQRLGSLMKECGLDVVHCRVYWRSNDGELFQIAKSRNPLKAALKHVLVYGLYHMSRIAPVGGLIEMFATKNRVDPRVGRVVA